MWTVSIYIVDANSFLIMDKTLSLPIGFPIGRSIDLDWNHISAIDDWLRHILALIHLHHLGIFGSIIIVKRLVISETSFVELIEVTLTNLCLRAVWIDNKIIVAVRGLVCYVSFHLLLKT